MPIPTSGCLDSSRGQRKWGSSAPYAHTRGVVDVEHRTVPAAARAMERGKPQLRGGSLVGDAGRAVRHWSTRMRSQREANPGDRSGSSSRNRKPNRTLPPDVEPGDPRRNRGCCSEKIEEGDHQKRRIAHGDRRECRRTGFPSASEHVALEREADTGWRADERTEQCTREDVRTPASRESTSPYNEAEQMCEGRDRRRPGASRVP